jgi:hypothetical protein
VNRLVGRLRPPTDVRGEAYLLDTATGHRAPASRWLVGRTLLADRRAALITLSDLQGATEAHVHEAAPPYHPYDLEATCYVRPDGSTLDAAQELLAVVELDFTHRLSVIDVRRWEQRLVARYAGETTRPDHAHNLSLVAFDPYEAAVYAPGPAGSIFRVNIPDGTSRALTGGHAEVAGLLLVRDQGLLLSAGPNGTLHLWGIESLPGAPVAAESTSAAPAADWALLSGDRFSRVVEFAG